MELKILKLHDKTTSLGCLSQKNSLICPISGTYRYWNTAKRVGTGLLIQALGRQMQVDLNEFKASQSWRVRPYQKTNKSPLKQRNKQTDTETLIGNCFGIIYLKYISRSVCKEFFLLINWRATTAVWPTLGAEPFKSGLQYVGLLCSADAPTEAMNISALSRINR